MAAIAYMPSRMTEYQIGAWRFGKMIALVARYRVAFPDAIAEIRRLQVEKTRLMSALGLELDETERLQAELLRLQAQEAK